MIQIKNEDNQKSKGLKPNHKYLYEKDQEMVKGKFIFHEVPGGTMSFTYKKWAQEPVKNYTFVDGDIYTIPLGVAVHLNKNCSYPIHAYMMDENKVPTMKVSQRVRRVSFQSLEFVDIEDLSPVGQPLLTVEALPR